LSDDVPFFEAQDSAQITHYFLSKYLDGRAYKQAASTLHAVQSILPQYSERPLPSLAARGDPLSLEVISAG
jgi:hypothetical protein